MRELKRNQINAKLEADRLNYIHRDKMWLIRLCQQLKEELAAK